MNTSIIQHNSPTALSTSVEATRNPALVYLAGRSSENSRRTMKKCLNMASDVLTNFKFSAPQKPKKSDYLDKADYVAAKAQYKIDRANYEMRLLAVNWTILGNEHLTVVKTVLSESHKFTTVNLVLSAMRGVIRQSWKLGHIDAELRDRITDIDNIKGQTLPTGRDVKNSELLNLLEDCAEDSNTVLGIRDYAILLLMRNMGLRRNEIVNLKLQHIDRATGEIQIIGAKGNKSRIDFISVQTLEAINRWITIRNGAETDALFVTVNKGGNLTHRKMTTQALYQMIQRRAQRQGITEITPHDLRRTMITRGLEAGIDVIVMSKRAGHASVETTKRYDRRSDETKRTAAEMLDDFTPPAIQQLLAI